MEKSNTKKEPPCKIDNINFVSQLVMYPRLVLWDLVAMDILEWKGQRKIELVLVKENGEEDFI